MVETYDQKSFELAEHFLPPTAPAEQKNRLALAIQQAVEDWFEEARLDDEGSSSLG